MVCIVDYLIGIITEQITYETHQLALLRRDSGVSNERFVTSGICALIGACAFLAGFRRMTACLV
ncbi:unnamed protein product, partial [Rotaria magnacalcarata]